MTHAVFDFAAIRHRLAQMNGTAPSGSCYVRAPGGNVVLAHAYDHDTDDCLKCGVSLSEVTDGLEPIACPGHFSGERCGGCGKPAVKTVGNRTSCWACGSISYPQQFRRDLKNDCALLKEGHTFTVTNGSTEPAYVTTNDLDGWREIPPGQSREVGPLKVSRGIDIAKATCAPSAADVKRKEQIAAAVYNKAWRNMLAYPDQEPEPQTVAEIYASCGIGLPMRPHFWITAIPGLLDRECEFCGVAMTAENQSADCQKHKPVASGYLAPTRKSGPF